VKLIDNCSSSIRKYDTNKTIDALIKDILDKNEELFEDLQKVKSFVVYNKELNDDAEVDID
jgi:hypothetical protein